MMEKKLYKVARDTNSFLKKFLNKQNKTSLISPMKYGLFPGGKQIRSKLLIDVGKIFSIDYKTLLHVSAAVECIHAYSLIHDDLPCMDDDILRRGKLTVHKKFSESTAILAGNSLLTISFEILSSNNFNVSSDVKNELIHSISRCAGHSGVAGGQHLDLEYEKQRVSMLKIIEMQRKKTGMLFEFCCIAPIIINKDKKNFKKFSSIGSDIGLLFQIADDLIDQSGNSKKVGKKTKKDQKKGKATLISLLGYKNAINYSYKLKNNIFKRLNKFGRNAEDLKETVNFILTRSK